ncbi:hypothetical protein ACROYT_G038047 [Oculina patagonica]
MEPLALSDRCRRVENLLQGQVEDWKFVKNVRPDVFVNFYKDSISWMVATSVMTKDPLVPAEVPNNKDIIHRVVLPFKDQTSADGVKKQLSDLGKKIDHTLQPVFKSRKIGEDLKMREPKPPLINQQCVVYNYQCDLCDADYVGYTSRHLHQRIDEHRFSAIGKHLKNDHGLNNIGDLTKCVILFSYIRKTRQTSATETQVKASQAKQAKHLSYISKIVPNGDVIATILPNWEEHDFVAEFVEREGDSTL